MIMNIFLITHNNRNGGYATSPLLDKYCGDIPKHITSLTNQLYLKLVTDSSRQKGGFKITWDSSTSGNNFAYFILRLL